MIVAEDRRLPRRLCVQKPVGSAGIEAQHPIPHGLQTDRADFGRLGARTTLIDQRQGQQATGLRCILAPTGKLAQATAS